MANHVGWDPSLSGIFITANLIVALCYGILGHIHLRKDAEDSLHWLYGAFIATCGFGHFVMAVHMSFFFSPILMTLSHVGTAIISGLTVLEVYKREYFNNHG